MITTGTGRVPVSPIATTAAPVRLRTAGGATTIIRGRNYRPSRLRPFQPASRKTAARRAQTIGSSRRPACRRQAATIPSPSKTRLRRLPLRRMAPTGRNRTKATSRPDQPRQAARRPVERVGAVRLAAIARLPPEATVESARRLHPHLPRNRRRLRHRHPHRHPHRRRHRHRRPHRHRPVRRRTARATAAGRSTEPTWCGLDGRPRLLTGLSSSSTRSIPPGPELSS